jgi:hypothetical protein
MVTKEDDQLVFRFPDVHPKAVLRISLQRTIRVPDDGKEYPLPAGLGRFPLRYVEDYAERLPADWVRRGGAMMAMHQSEALWINFSSDYPMAVKVAAGKINAVTGKPWQDGLSRDPQDYLVPPRQPWLDGFNTEGDVVRQFVAARLGDGHSVEEQLTGEAVFGGIQIIAYPLKREFYELELLSRIREAGDDYLDLPMFMRRGTAMGVAMGGRIRQAIYEDHRELSEWETSRHSRCFLHLVDARDWQGLTGEAPPDRPIDHDKAVSGGLPWFTFHDSSAKGLSASPLLAKLKSLGSLTGKKKYTKGKPVPAANVVPLVTGDKVSDGDWG